MNNYKLFFPTFLALVLSKHTNLLLPFLQLVFYYYLFTFLLIIFFNYLLFYFMFFCFMLAYFFILF